MPTITITNKAYSQALRGENIKVTVDLATQSSEFSQLQLGQICEDEDGNLGLIYSIDNFGNSFEISPVQPNLTMSNGEGYAYSEQNITITI